MSKGVIEFQAVDLPDESNLQVLLNGIRFEWQAKKLISRVRKLLNVDPSSACQKILNAAMHDLREKIAIAGIDIAQEAAKQQKLPPITGQEELEDYPTSKLIDLAYRMGLLSRAEWRRVSRCYEIRRDLEHEDDEYEASFEDCVYVFGTCIEVILSREPIVLVKVTDFKDLIEQATSIIPDDSLLVDYKGAPQRRQEEVLKFLISHALDKEKSDIIQQNAYKCLSYLCPLTHQAVFVKVGEHLQKKAGRKIDERMARVAHAAGVFAYLRRSARVSLYGELLKRFRQVGIRWTANEQHGGLLRSFMESGGLEYCPDEVKTDFLKWLVLTYLGEPGGLTSFGNIRHVFYSNSAAPLIRDIVASCAPRIHQELVVLREDDEIMPAIRDEYVARRFEALIRISKGE